MKEIIDYKELDSKIVYYEDCYGELIKLGTEAKVVGLCEYDNDYYEWGYHNSSIVIRTDLDLYFKIILTYCSYYNGSNMSIVSVHNGYSVNITHFPIKDYYIDLKSITSSENEFKCDVFEFACAGQFKVYEEKFIKYSMERIVDILELKIIMNNRKRVKEELLRSSLSSI